MYAASRWGVVACYGKPYLRTVAEVYGLLYKSLAERTAADDYASVVVLYCSGNDFACRCRCLVDKYHKWCAAEYSVSVGALNGLCAVCPLGIYNDVSLVKELVSHLKCNSQVSSAIAAKVYYESLSVAVCQFNHCLYELGECILGKTLDLYIAPLVVDEVVGFDTLYRYLVAAYDEIEQVGLAITLYS